VFILAPHTDTWFSWTIEPPLTAAFLGGSYAAGNAMVVRPSGRGRGRRPAYQW
jgi:hypothetical protein